MVDFYTFIVCTLTNGWLIMSEPIQYLSLRFVRSTARAILSTMSQMSQDQKQNADKNESTGEEWQRIKAAFLKNLSEEGFGEEDCTQFEEELMYAKVEFEVNSQRGLGETLDKWHLWHELLNEENAVCGRCDVRGETIEELWDFLTGPRAGFAFKARVYVDDRVLYEGLREKVCDALCPSCFEDRGDYLELKLCGGRKLKVHCCERDSDFNPF